MFVDLNKFQNEIENDQCQRCLVAPKTGDPLPSLHAEVGNQAANCQEHKFTLSRANQTGLTSQDASQGPILYQPKATSPTLSKCKHAEDSPDFTQTRAASESRRYRQDFRDSGQLQHDKDAVAHDHRFQPTSVNQSSKPPSNAAHSCRHQS